ncbi:hypothetical protein EBR96_07865 [bacterium]|nr:hypothetical protein [bacterium]
MRRRDAAAAVDVGMGQRAGIVGARHLARTVLSVGIPLHDGLDVEGEQPAADLLRRIRRGGVDAGERAKNLAVAAAGADGADHAVHGAALDDEGGHGAFPCLTRGPFPRASSNARDAGPAGPVAGGLGDRDLQVAALLLAIQVTASEAGAQRAPRVSVDLAGAIEICGKLRDARRHTAAADFAHGSGDAKPVHMQDYAGTVGKPVLGHGVCPSAWPGLSALAMSALCGD